MIFYRCLFCLLLALKCSLSNSQQADNTYLFYLKDFETLSGRRGITGDEVKQVLTGFSKINIVSNSMFADYSGLLYSKKKGIGILLYFFKNDTLRRAFFEPGMLLEERVIPIKKEELLKLGDAVNHSLNLYELTSNRAPVLKRGTDVENLSTSSSSYNLDTTIQQLSSILLPDLFDEKYQHLIVIPALNIGSIPFHLLRPYKDGSYLIDKCSFTIAPSLVDFVGLRLRVLNILRGRVDEPDKYIDFDQQVKSHQYANPDSVRFVVDRALFVCNPAYPVNTRYVFPDLPGAVKEVDSASIYFPNHVLLKGERAIKDSVITYLNQTDIGYFATHGMSSADSVMDKTSLVLAGSDAFLTSREVQNLRLRNNYRMPELVILSACQTGLGKSMEAGTAGSMARSFILSGSNHVVMSLWNVDDEATAFLMNRFIYYLKHSKSFQPSAHLRMAILDTKKKFLHPRYWASFSFIGTDY